MTGHRRQQEHLNAAVLEIIRMSTEDGPGIRTTVFFKGCPLKCQWCHNPESISPAPELCWVGSRCIGCGTCLEVCARQALDLSDAGLLIDRSRCAACGDCAEACPGGALELLGRQWDLAELTAELLKDRAYYEASGGGVTLSGGEPLMQADFAAALLQRLRHEGIHTAVDTCGLCSQNVLENVLVHAGMVMFDVKIMDPEEHRRLTGQENSRILENLCRVAASLQSRLHPAALWIRTPVIPGATDDPANISAIGDFITRHLTGAVDRWDLCAFNNLCRDKYMRLDRDWAYAHTELVTARHMEALAQTARQSVADPEIVCWSGATRRDSDAATGEQNNGISCCNT
ncbi:MAG: glycyl-radical enzyme activating protein [Desulfobacterales bacterium]